MVEIMSDQINSLDLEINRQVLKEMINHGQIINTKILEDNKTIEEMNIEEKKMIFKIDKLLINNKVILLNNNKVILNNNNKVILLKIKINGIQIREIN